MVTKTRADDGSDSGLPDPMLAAIARATFHMATTVAQAFLEPTRAFLDALEHDGRISHEERQALSAAQAQRLESLADQLEAASPPDRRP